MPYKTPSMPAFSKAKKLSSLFRSAIKSTDTSSSTADDVALKQYVTSLDTSTEPNPKPSSIIKPKQTAHQSVSTSLNSDSLSNFVIDSFNLDPGPNSEDSKKQLSREISSILCGDTALDLDNSPDSGVATDKKSLERVLDIPWFSSMSQNNILRRKEISRERKQKWVFKSTQTNRLQRLVRMCAQKLGTDATIQVFGKLGRETGVKEFNALIGLCIEKARQSEDEEVSLEQIYKAYQLFNSMKEQGFPVEAETYGPFLMYLIDMRLVEEFHFFCGIIRDANPNSLSSLAYHEMLLWIRVNNEDKIQELCNRICVGEGGDKSGIQENYLLALCKSDRKKEVLLLLESFDITKVSSLNRVENIFKSLGRLLLESYMEKFLLALKTCDVGEENLSRLIYHYAISMPNLAVEDVILKFKKMQSELELTPSSVPYEKLITYCCDSLKVHVALDIVDQMFKEGLTLTIETLHSILNTCEESCEYNLVRRIYSLICRHNLTPTHETFKSMISLCVRMKDFDGAYDMLCDQEKMNLMPTASMYNAIMAGYFREKNINCALMVLKQMEDADVKPDSQTFCYLIGNCTCEEDVIKYYEEFKLSGAQVTKHVYKALINAYADCGQFEKAKQVVLDKGIPVKNLNEIKSVLVSSLAYHSKLSDALSIYEEIKQAGCHLEPKSILYLIENLQSEGELSRLLQLLEELNDPNLWVDGCLRIILYCVRHKHLSSAVDLLRQLKDKLCNDEVAEEVMFDEVFCQVAEMEPIDLKIGLDLLQAIKDLGVRPSRKSLDFLLSACVIAKDLKNSLLIWKEYETAGLPYNVLSYVRMYQALLASGGSRYSKDIIYRKIPKGDPHVRCVVQACNGVYRRKKKKKEKEVEENS